MRTLPFLLILLLILGAMTADSAPAQSLDPAPSLDPAQAVDHAQALDPAWGHTVRTLAETLAAVDQRAADTTLHSIAMHRFGSPGQTRPVALLAQTSGGRVISARAYGSLPDTLAGDIADDFAASDLPEIVRQQFTPPSAEQMRQANTLAARWITDSLHLTRPAPVALLVIWRGDSALPSMTIDEYRRHIVFVMVRGQTDENGVARPVSIVFGNPLLTPR